MPSIFSDITVFFFNNWFFSWLVITFSCSMSCLVVLLDNGKCNHYITECFDIVLFLGNTGLYVRRREDQFYWILSFSRLNMVSLLLQGWIIPTAKTLPSLGSHLIAMVYHGNMPFWLIKALLSPYSVWTHRIPQYKTTSSFYSLPYRALHNTSCIQQRFKGTPI